MAKQKGGRKVGRTARKAKRKFATPRLYPVLGPVKADAIRRKMNELGATLTASFDLVVPKPKKA